MLGFGKTQASGLSELLAKKKYGKAIEVIRGELLARGRDTRLRTQLADVLQRAGRASEAVPLLLELADDFALSGSPAKAIATLKRAQAIAPDQPEIESHLAYLISQQKAPTPYRWHRAKAAIDSSAPEAELGGAPSFLGDIEEIGAEPVPAGPVAADAVPHEVAPSKASAPAPLPVAEPPAAPEPSVAAEPPAVPEPSVAAEQVAVAEPVAEPTEEAFVDEVIALFDDVLSGRLAPAAGELAAVPAVDTPLFREFSCEELIEVIRGLRLRAFAPGEIIVSEGESGDSLFVLTTGEVRAYVRGAQGHASQVRTLREGDFFGEVSLLEFEGRTATVTAAAHCELLEIDRATLDRISRSHPRIWDVIRRFYQARSGSAAELAARAKGPAS